MPRIRGKLCNLVPIMLLSGVFILIILGAYVLQKSFNSGNGTVLRETLEHDQLKRTYLLYLPEGYDFSERLPLVINMHGYMSSARQQMYYGDFREIADREQFLLVHPQGTRHRGATHWNVGGKPAGSTVDDIGFINKLIDELAAGYNIDLSRVYATGISNGGAMSLNLAINLSNRIAAVASVVGPMTYPMKESEHEPKAMPMVLFFGTDDKVIPYEGDDTVLPVDETLKFWMERNGLDYNSGSLSLVEDRQPSDGARAEYIVYEGGSAPIELYRIIGGGHTWPGAPGMLGLLGPTCQDFDASEVIWDFFSRYRLE